MTMIYNPSDSFHEAASYLSSASSLSSVSNSTKLELYAIFKYLTVSPTPNTPKPSIFDFTGKAKWDAWQTTGKTYQDRAAEAEKRYIEIARSLGWSEGQKTEATESHETTGNEEETEDIWDSDSEVARRKQNKSGSAMGHFVSTMSVGEEDQEPSTVSGMVIEGDVQAVSSYLETHPAVDVNSPDANGYVPLHLAADRGHLGVVKLLLERGADLSIKDPDEFTAKELAEIAGHTDIVDLLSNAQNETS